MGITYQQENDQGFLTVEGELGLAQAEELRMTLIKSIIDVEELKLDLSKSSSIDLSALQLFCSAHRSAIRMNKRVTFSTDLPEHMKKTMQDAGYTRSVGCHLDCDGTCLWVNRSACTAEAGGEEANG